MTEKVYFDYEFAKKHGIEKAIFIHEIAKWIELAKNLEGEIPFCFVDGMNFVQLKDRLGFKKFEIFGDDFGRNTVLYDVINDCKKERLIVISTPSDKDYKWYAIGQNAAEYQYRNQPSRFQKLSSDRYGGNHEFVVNRENGRCAICGSKENTVVHHIDGYVKERPENNAKNKLILLCKSCHGKIHHSRIWIPRHILAKIGYFED